jgi:hypothetical protein
MNWDSPMFEIDFCGCAHHREASGLIPVTHRTALTWDSLLEEAVCQMPHDPNDGPFFLLSRQ